MPLFEGAKPIADSRSNSRLSVSQVFSPAERWIHDPSLPGLFEYHYGGPGKVVLSKGTIVAFADEPVVDYEYSDMGVPRTTFGLTYANGQNNPIGILPYNVYQKIDDRFDGNQPNIYTHEYIELPFIRGIEHVYNLEGLVGGLGDLTFEQLVDRMKMKWGCYYSVDMDPENMARPGDFLVSDKFGKFVKLDLATATVPDLARIVGQVLAVETDMPPIGWLKWVTPVVDEGERADDDNRKDAPDPTTGYDYDPNFKFPLTGDHRSPGPWKDYNGIPGLTDGEESGLGAGILPGWDFQGSIGAIRIALRY